jgi:hypothetical protein
MEQGVAQQTPSTEHTFWEIPEDLCCPERGTSTGRVIASISYYMVPVFPYLQYTFGAKLYT